MKQIKTLSVLSALVLFFAACGVRGQLSGNEGPGSLRPGNSLIQSEMRDSMAGNYRGADLKGARFAGSMLYGKDLGGADCSNSDFSGSDLRNADMRGCNLTKADFSGSNLRGANLSGAMMSETNFTGANLQGADLSFSTINSADFTGSDCTGATVSKNSRTMLELQGIRGRSDIVWVE
jgi:uncharacterized protein YjbI with pentapeptide repeats